MELELLDIQWILLVILSGILFLLSPLSKTTQEFFQATVKDKQPSAFVLTASLVISWLFAKSITNAANLGLKYGIAGGVAYAGYYLSFLVAGIVIYRMRTQGGFTSIHDFLKTRYGQLGLVIFSVLIGFRLFNEIWSNTMVIGSYFGDIGSSNYYLSILVFTGLTLFYSLKGGLRSSLLTDLIQMALFAVLLFVILGMILPEKSDNLSAFVTESDWSLSGATSLLLVAFIQVFSYPFHDPVMTDRGFISAPKTTLKSFIWATIIGAICIILFSFVGVYARLEGVAMGSQAAVEVGKLFGTVLMLVMNIIMVTSAASTIDSTFSSFSKLAVVDLGGEKWATVTNGRIAMIMLAIVGTIPVFFNPTILSATTVSGTMVLGLAPVFIFWKLKMPKIAFPLAVLPGIVLGILYAAKVLPDSWDWTGGSYGKLLAVNVIGTILCFAFFFLAKLIFKEKE